MKFISNSNDLSRFLEIPIAKNIPLRSISLDSRTIKKGALFFAIKGKNFNDYLSHIKWQFNLSRAPWWGRPDKIYSDNAF